MGVIRHVPDDEPDPIDPADFPAAENEQAGRSFVATYGRYAGVTAPGNASRRCFRLPWGIVGSAVTQILGTTEAVGGTLVRTAPWVDYDNRELLAVQADVYGESYQGAAIDDQAAPELPPMVGGNLYRQAVIEVRFERPLWELGDRESPESTALVAPAYEQTRYCVKRVLPNRESYAVQPRSLVFRDVGGVAGEVPFPVYKSDGFDDIEVVWLDVPRDSVPMAAIRACLFKVNEDRLELPRFPPPRLYDPETLLLLSYALEHMTFPDGRPGCHVRYFMRYRHNSDNPGLGFGWNYFPKPGLDSTQDRFKAVEYRDSPNHEGPFPAADFDTLFVPV